MSDSIDDLVFRFLSGELSGEEEQEVLRRIADDPDGRNLLKLELGLKQTLSFEERDSVPEGFADRTMAAIAEAEEGAAAEAPSPWAQVREHLRGWVDWLTRPQSVRLRPAYGLAAAVLLAIGLGFFDAGLRQSDPIASAPENPAAEQTEADRAAPVQTATSGAEATPNLVSTRFTYVNNAAESVAIAGDFNGWEPQPMQPRTVNGQTVWTTTLPLREGEHQYMFRVNGEKWVTDPLAPVQRSDGFGHKNAVIAI